MLNNLIRFVANTKAKASEVNYNFDQVKAKIQELDDWKTSTDDRLNKYSSFQLFDLIVTDRVLTGEEAKGKLLQGSLVTNLYPDAVAKIKEEWESGAWQTYTYGENISFPYRLAPNRHMIVDVLYKDDVDALFAATGVAWFYIWDKDNEQFYLPRNLWFDQYTNDPEQVNKYNEAGIPDHKHTITARGGYSVVAYEASRPQVPSAAYHTGTWNNLCSETLASEYDPIYGKSNTVQPPSSNKLLYFVVGNTYVNQEDIDIAQVESDLNNKLNIDHSNDTKPYITETYVNGTEGYILFSNNFSIQWGRLIGETAGYYTVNLLLEMADTNYSCLHSFFSLSTPYNNVINGTYLSVWDLTTTSFTTDRYLDNQISTMWVVLGYAV